jgi:hypothetical protein
MLEYQSEKQMMLPLIGQRLGGVIRGYSDGWPSPPLPR